MRLVTQYKMLVGVLSLGLITNSVLASPQNSKEVPVDSEAHLEKTWFKQALNQLTSEDYIWIGQRIYQNECAGSPNYLTYWGRGEEFPSFGIGHFIWFPQNINPPFTETFPQMVQFVSKTHPVPMWLQKLAPFKAPWHSKKQFEQAWSGPELTELRDWLLATQAHQAEFIVAVFQQRWEKEISRLPLNQQHELQAKLEVIMRFREGLFSVIDYFNFKGIGVNPKEQYQGESWGLVSVLKQFPAVRNMPKSNEDKLSLFVQKAKQRLLLRTQLAPAERNESRWLKGWYKRLDGYLIK